MKDFERIDQLEKELEDLKDLTRKTAELSVMNHEQIEDMVNMLRDISKSVSEETNKISGTIDMLRSLKQR